MTDDYKIYDVPIESGHITVRAKSKEEAESKASSQNGKIEIIQCGEAYES